MATERIYYQDAYLRTLDAQVQTCEKKGKNWAVVLDKTIFFPEGGGQAPDSGTLNGIPIIDVQESGENVLHYCSKPFEPGELVHCELDWNKRFRLMQQHSGEHLVSGLIHKRYGWDNVGFHMGTDGIITIDFSGPIPLEDISSLEWAANQAVWDNIEADIFYPSAEELGSISYRSKKALSGQVRLVRFPGIDLCACCGTHVRRTGEVGLIKILSCIKFREGVRIEMICGMQAFLYLSNIAAQNHENSVLLSAKPLETAAAVRRVYDERNDAFYRLSVAENQRFTELAAHYDGAGNCVLFEDNLSSNSICKLAIAVMERCGGRCAVFSGNDKEGYKYAVGYVNGDLRSFIKEMNAALSGRGGGKPSFAQGSLRAKRTDIETFFKES